MTASYHLKQRTGSLGGDQDEKAVQELITEDRLRVIATSGTNCFKQSVPAEGESIAKEILTLRAALAQKTRECEELTQDRNEWKDAAHTRGAEASGLMRDCDNLKAQVEQLGRQVAEMALRLNYNQFDHTTPECFRGRGRGASAYKAAFESAWRGREFDGELYTREPHRSAWRKGYIEGQQAFALASRART